MSVSVCVCLFACVCMYGWLMRRRGCSWGVHAQVGLAFLQQFLLRAEELKQQNAVTPAQLTEWCVL
jgi:hypothetical protein